MSLPTRKVPLPFPKTLTFFGLSPRAWPYLLVQSKPDPQRLLKSEWGVWKNIFWTECRSQPFSCRDEAPCLSWSLARQNTYKWTFISKTRGADPFYQSFRAFNVALLHTLCPFLFDGTDLLTGVSTLAQSLKFSPIYYIICIKAIDCVLEGLSSRLVELYVLWNFHL